MTGISYEKRGILLINYEATDGFKRHDRLWNSENSVGTVKLYRGSTRIDVIGARNVGCEYGE